MCIFHACWYHEIGTFSALPSLCEGNHRSPVTWDVGYILCNNMIEIKWYSCAWYWCLYIFPLYYFIANVINILKIIVMFMMLVVMIDDVDWSPSWSPSSSSPSSSMKQHHHYKNIVNLLSSNLNFSHHSFNVFCQNGLIFDISYYITAIIIKLHVLIYTIIIITIIVINIIVWSSLSLLTYFSDITFYCFIMLNQHVIKGMDKGSSSCQ